MTLFFVLFFFFVIMDALWLCKLLSTTPSPVTTATTFPLHCLLYSTLTLNMEKFCFLEFEQPKIERLDPGIVLSKYSQTGRKNYMNYKKMFYVSKYSLVSRLLFWFANALGSGLGTRISRNIT